MSNHRVILVALAIMFTAGITSAALSCCEWGGPIPPAPIYVVNQGPDYTGPGLMVPYRVYGPDAGAAPPTAYSYVAGEAYPARYALNPYYAGAGPVIPYRERAYYHGGYLGYAGPVGSYHPCPRYQHHPLSVRY
jgi:hypothetical protein